MDGAKIILILLIPLVSSNGDHGMHDSSDGMGSGMEGGQGISDGHEHGSDDDCLMDDDDSDMSSDDHDHDHNHDDDDKDVKYDGKEGACPSTEHSFYGKGNYIELADETPPLKSISICTFATTDGNGIFSGVIGSIHTDRKSKNLIVLGKVDKKRHVIRIIIEGQVRNIQRKLPPNAELHVCMVTNTDNNTVIVYLNGQRTRELQYHRITGLPSGTLRIGRMKDDRFDMYTGKVRNFMLWNKMLTPEEIKKIFQENYCPGDAKVVLDPSSIVPMSANVPSEECPMVARNFINTGDKVEYFELGTLPKMKFATVCAVVTTDERGIIPGTIASYATISQPESLSVGGEIDINGKAWTRFVVAGQTKRFPGQFRPNTDYRFCIVYQFQQNKLMTYIDGQLSITLMLEDVNFLPGGGTAILGQRQRREGGCFDRSVAYNGKLTDFMIWSRVLSEEEITAYSAGQCPTDAIVTTAGPDSISYGMCPMTEFIIKNQGNTMQYVKVTKTLPDTELLTVCGAVTTDARGMIPGILGSYSTTANNQSIAVGGEMGSNGPMFHLTINGETKRSLAQFVPNTKYHFCISLHTSHNHAYTYVNGFLSGEYTFSDMGDIDGGGEIIVGQLQGCPGGCFNRDVPFNGKLENFMVWNRILSVAEMRAMAKENKCPNDQIIDLTQGNAEFVSIKVEV